MSASELPSAADVVVVGCGAAGLSAAIEAADRGADVLVLESQPEPAGSTRLSAGYAVFCETEMEPGGAEELYADLLEAHHEDHDETLVRRYVEAAPRTYRRLVELGVDFARTFQFAHMHRPWAHEVQSADVHGGAELGRRLERAARQRGVRIVTAARARRLHWDHAGRVDGVQVERGGALVDVAARAGVVLASGGFTRNRDLIANYGPPGAERILPITGAGSLGDGLKMAQARGADTAYIHAGVAPTGPADPKTGKGTMVIYSGAVILNRDGRRFCDESGLYNDISWAALKQPEALMFIVYDAAVREAYLNSMLGRALSGYEERSADTLAGVVELLRADGGLDAAAAVESLDRYNSNLADGRDPDFGRTHLVGVSGVAPPIATPPFHGIITVPGTTHFNGGLKIDRDMRVIDVYGQAIPALFAAGEVTGGFHGRGYLSGTHVGMALVFGQIAGRSVVAAA
jgi:fumarate reductase flavoprotein subunit